MKKTIIGLTLISILLITLVLTGCGNTSGKGVFIDEETEDVSNPYYTSVSFQIKAAPIGEPYENSIGEDGDLLYIYFQPAKGHLKLVTTDLTNPDTPVVKADCTLDGTLYVAPEDYQYLSDYLSNYFGEDYLVSGYVGSIEQKMDKETFTAYVLAVFGDYNGEDTETNKDKVDIYLYSEPIVENGVWVNSNPWELQLYGDLIEGDVAIK